VRGAALRRGQRRSEHAHDDGGHGGGLAAARMLAEHPLADHQQHEQPGRQGGLHDDEGSEQQGRYLQGPAEDGKTGPKQPAGAAHELADQAQAQIVVLANLSRIQGLQGDP